MLRGVPCCLGLMGPRTRCPGTPCWVSGFPQRPSPHTSALRPPPQYRRWLSELRSSPPLAGSVLPHLSCFSVFFPLPFVFLLLQTSSSAVALNSLGLPPSSAPSSHHIRPSPPSPPPSPLPPPGPSILLPPTIKPSSGGHGLTTEALCHEDDEEGQGLLPPVAPSWLDLAGLGVTPETPNSRSPSAEGSLGPFGAESQARGWRDALNLKSELCRAPPGHTRPQAGCAGPQEPGDLQGLSASPAYPEEALAATWEQPWALEALRPETPHRATPSFQEVTEPAVVAIDRQVVFPDTWSPTKERGQLQEGTRPEPAGPESIRPAPVDQEQLGGEMPVRRSPIRPTQGPETARRPAGTAEAAAEAERARPELPQAVVTDTPTTERISTSGQAGASLHGGWAWSSRPEWAALANCMPPPTAHVCLGSES